MSGRQSFIMITTYVPDRLFFVMIIRQTFLYHDYHLPDRLFFIMINRKTVLYNDYQRYEYCSFNMFFGTFYTYVQYSNMTIVEACLLTWVSNNQTWFTKPKFSGTVWLLNSRLILLLRSKEWIVVLDQSWFGKEYISGIFNPKAVRNTAEQNVLSLSQR